MIPIGLKDKIEAFLGKSILGASRVAGGDINHAAEVKLSNSLTCFLKWNTQAPPGFFTAEATGLAELAKCKGLKVPEVLLASEEQDGVPAFLLQEMLIPCYPSKDNWKSFGVTLANLHRITSDSFGFRSDNFIGLTPQSNSCLKSWPDFFWCERLLKQASIGAVNGWFKEHLQDLFLSKEKRILDILGAEQDPKPSLLHGDMWIGNVFWCADGHTLLDPAVYYGSREADLAYSQLFGGFPEEFYKAYDDAYRLSKGFENRRDILNLYHIMNHANMFGGTYIQQTRLIIERI